MTVDQYYSKKSKLQSPPDLEFLQERKWYVEAIEKLQSQLSESDLKIVKESQRNWQEKVNSSIY